jgi:hypothetical protein
MRWATVTASQTEEEWFEDYVKLALATPAPSLPPTHQKIGACDVTWFPCEEGIAHIHTTGGTVDDRILAEMLVRNQLRGHGIKQAEYSFDPDEDFRKTATWDDVMAKAKRLIQSGNVQLLRNGYNNVVGHVVGDHGEYQTEIMRQDPNSRTITQWSCDCPWDQYAFQRTRQWKKYEARPCAHVLATYWKSLSTPLDEDIHPAQSQQSLFTPQNAMQQLPGPAFVTRPGAPVPGPQGQQLMLPGMFPGMATGTPPGAPGAPPGAAPPDIIPPYPMDALQQGDQSLNPASVPGLRQPSPTNPVQYPGGTFSKVRDDWDFGTATQHYVSAQPNLVNGMMVSTKNDDWGVWQGRSDEHGAGSPARIPAGSPGEVLGVDPSTGMVNVLFMNNAIGVQEHGKMMPWGATAWFWPSEVTHRPDIQPPGPAVRRK